MTEFILLYKYIIKTSTFNYKCKYRVLQNNNKVNKSVSLKVLCIYKWTKNIQADNKLGIS